MNGMLMNKMKRWGNQGVVKPPKSKKVTPKPLTDSDTIRAITGLEFLPPDLREKIIDDYYRETHKKRLNLCMRPQPFQHKEWMAYPVVLCRSYLRGSATPVDDEWKSRIARRDQHLRSDKRVVNEFREAFFQEGKKRMGRTIHDGCIYIPISFTAEQTAQELEIRGHIAP